MCILVLRFSFIEKTKFYPEAKILKHDLQAHLILGNLFHFNGFMASQLL